MNKDIASIVEGWPLSRDSVAARIVTGADDQQFLQMRINLGVLQMHLDGRPDGRPADTVLQHLQKRASREGESFDPTGDNWDHLEREVMQFYHRRIALLTVGGDAQRTGDTDIAATCYRRAVRDADHNLAIMDFIQEHSDDPESVENHEKYRPFVLLHRTLAAAQEHVLNKRYEDAIDTVKIGKSQISDAYEQQEKSDLTEFDPSLLQLRLLERRLRKQFSIKRTLREQLEDAVKKEDFELAARLRDRLKKTSQDYSPA